MQHLNDNVEKSNLLQGEKDLKSWGDAIETLTNSDNIVGLYHKPGIKKLIVLVEPTHLSHAETFTQSIKEIGEVIILPNSPYVNKSAIIADGYREIGMQRLILESVQLNFVLNYPGDIPGYGITDIRQTRVTTQLSALDTTNEPVTSQRWYEADRNTILDVKFCRELDAIVDLSLDGDSYAKSLRVNIANRI